MSRQLRDMAWRLINNAQSQLRKGLYKEALLTLKKAQEFSYKIEAADTISVIFSLIGDAMHSAELYDEAIKNYTTALEIQEKLSSSDPFFKSWNATTLNSLGELLGDMGKFEDAKIRYEQSLQIYEALLKNDPENSTHQLNVAITLNNLGDSFSNMGRIGDAKIKFESALRIHETHLKHDPKNSIYQELVAGTLNNLGNLLSNMGRFEDAKTKYERALQMREMLLKKDTINSMYQSDVATTLNNLATLLNLMDKLDDAKSRYEQALQMRESLLKNDPDSRKYQSWVATTLNNLAALLSKLDKLDNAKSRYEQALQMRESLLKSDPENSIYQSWVAGTLNNLAILLSEMGKLDDAKTKFEHALDMYELLLKNDSENSVYQSNVAMTLNNLGDLLSDLGRPKDAKQIYKKSLDIYTEPLQYQTTRTKSRAIINIIQLVLDCAKKETNLLKKQDYFEEVYAVYTQHESFFTEYGLEHENQLARESGLSAHIQHLILNAKNETDTDKRIEEYEKCIHEVKIIAETEDDDKLKKLWLSVMHYLEGRQLVNNAIKLSPPEKNLIKQAIERFKLAKDIYKNANVCYCIYKVLLELESIEVLDDVAVTRMKKLLHDAIENLPEEMDVSVKSAFREIELLLDKNVKAGPEMFIKLNKCITKIDYYALREHFSYIYQNIASYLKEPFSPNVSYSNWTLTFTFDEPEKVQGKLTIKAGDTVLFDAPLDKSHKIYIERHPRMKEETISFIAENGKNVTRQVYYSDVIKCDVGRIDAYILEHDCRRGITSGYFNIAIAQLKYELFKESNAVKINDDETYFKKVTSILEELKGKADLIVFPEFSIPFDYLPFLKQYSDGTGIVIIAGSHYVTDENLDKYSGLFDTEFGENDILKNISPMIIPSSKIMHTEKIFGAKVERPLFFEEGMRHGTLNRIFKLRDNVTCGIMICFDFLNDELRQRVTDACNIIVVPQSNPKTERFHNIGKIEIDNLRGVGNKAYIMASGIFTFDSGEEILGGDSGVILTLDKDSHKKQGDAIIKSIEDVKEQFVLLVSLNMNFNASRDTQLAQAPMRTELIHIFEEREILNSKKDKPPSFLDLLEKIDSCKDRIKLRQLLKDNESVIKTYSPLMYKHCENLENLDIDQMKRKCHVMVIK